MLDLTRKKTTSRKKTIKRKRVTITPSKTRSNQDDYQRLRSRLKDLGYEFSSSDTVDDIINKISFNDGIYRFSLKRNIQTGNIEIHHTYPRSGIAEFNGTRIIAKTYNDALSKYANITVGTKRWHEIKYRELPDHPVFREGMSYSERNLHRKEIGPFDLPSEIHSHVKRYLVHQSYSGDAVRIWHYRIKGREIYEIGDDYLFEWK
jgi:hypothetical protein